MRGSEVQSVYAVVEPEQIAHPARQITQEESDDAIVRSSNDVLIQRTIARSRVKEADCVPSA